MPKFNILWAVVDVIEADTGEAAIENLTSRLRAAGFEPYEGTPDLVPAGYDLAFPSEGL